MTEQENKIQGILFDIQCRCVLPQMRNRTTPEFFKFPAFVAVDDVGAINPTYAQCPFCGATYNVVDTNKAILIDTKLAKIENVKDIQQTLYPEIIDIFSSYDLSLAQWQKIRFIIQNKLWEKENQISTMDNVIIIRTEQLEDKINGKRIRILSEKSAQPENINYETGFFVKGQE